MNTDTTILWPADVNYDGICYGWTNPLICVAGVLKEDCDSNATDLLQRALASPQWAMLRKSCLYEPVILGKCLFDNGRGASPSLMFPPVKNYTLFYYQRHAPHSLRFYSLHMLRFESIERPAKHPSSPNGFKHNFNIIPLSSHGGIDETVIAQFNSAILLDAILCPSSTWRHSRGPSFTNQISMKLYDSLANCILFFCGWLASVCNIPITLQSQTLLFKDMSNTVQQIDVRTEQAQFLFTEMKTLSHRETIHIALYCARYTNFFNAVWLILNDLTIGVAVGSFLCDNHVFLARTLNLIIKSVLIDWIQWALSWLDSWPAGLKLNTELSAFYSHTFISIVALWGELLQRGAPYLPSILYIFGVLSCGGLTVTLSLFSDLLGIVTAHIYACYLLSDLVYEKMLVTAGSLWNLFRGKRYNVLRNRTDSWEYDMDQLLFGTILFTLLAFLFPTVLVYYALFALMRLGTIIFHACMETQLAFMNHFPLFALMLRAKDPWRLPGGVYFVMGVSNASSDTPFIVKNQPLPFSSIFFQYIRLWSRLSSHYNPLRLLRCLLSGEFIAPIPRYSIRYTKIDSSIK